MTKSTLSIRDTNRFEYIFTFYEDSKLLNFHSKFGNDNFWWRLDQFNAVMPFVNTLLNISENELLKLEEFIFRYV